MEQNLKLATFRLDPVLWDEFLSLCQKQGFTAKDVLTEFVRHYVEGNREEPTTKINLLEQELKLIKQDVQTLNERLNQFDLEKQFALRDSKQKDQIEQEIKNAMNPWRDDLQIARRAMKHIPEEDDDQESNLDRLFSDEELSRIYGLRKSFFAQARKQNFPPKKLLDLFAIWEVVGTKWKLRPIKPLTRLQTGYLVVFDPNAQPEWIGLYGKVEEIGKHKILVRLWNGEVKVASPYDLYQLIEKREINSDF